jgi:Extensin-like protein C-terminus
MGAGLRFYLLGFAVLAGLAMLAGCGGFPFAQREAWRTEAEVECLSAGSVKEGPGIVRLSPIRGPGICGAEYPLRVAMFGESGPLAFDDPRPPGTIPSGPSNWPIRSRDVRPAPRYSDEAPISLHPPDLAENPAPASSDYDFYRPYGQAPPSPPRYPASSRRTSPREDVSPVPYERRHLVEGDEAPMQRPGTVSRAPLAAPLSQQRAPASEEWTDEPVRRPTVPPLVPLGSAPGAQMPGSVTAVALNPPATLACPIVSELDRWITGAVQPAAVRWFGSPVAAIKQISAYSCRGMNGNPYARVSEHAFGNALDIAAFTLADGRTITVKNGWHGLPEEQGFLRDVQAAACNQFTTVLAPGSNVYHYDHIHVDLMRRGSGGICNPHAVSGEEVAARLGGRYAGRRPGYPYVTGSLPPRRVARRDGADGHGKELPERALPIAQPGADGDE